MWKPRHIVALTALATGVIAQTSSPPRRASGGAKQRNAPTVLRSASPKTANAAPSSALSAYSYETVWNSSRTIGNKHLESIADVEVNDNDDVVFSATFDSRHIGIFTPNKIVAAMGEPLGNGPIALALSDPRINNKGQIAYGATFVDPKDGPARGYFVDNALTVEFKITDEFNFNDRLGYQPTSGPLIRTEAPAGITGDGKILLNKDDATGVLKTTSPI